MVQIITDSVASIPTDLLDGADVEIVTLFVNHEGAEFVDATMDVDDFYSRIHCMVDNLPTSSQPSLQSLEEAFERVAAQKRPALGIFISSALSGTYDNAVRAARAVKARNLDFAFRVVDSRSCGFDEAAVVLDALDAAKAGESLEKCAQAALDAVVRSRFLFTPETLTFLQKGGRIGNAAALLGNLVRIAPVLTVVDGCATQFAKVRTRKKALQRIVEQFKADVDAHGLKRVAVHYIGDKAPAVSWAKEAIEPLIGHAVRVMPVSPVVGMHVGPAVGIAYECLSPLQGKLTIPNDSLVCAG